MHYARTVLSFSLRATKEPRVALSATSGATVTATWVDIELSAVSDEGNKLISLLGLDANCTAGINFAAADDLIKINVTEISLQVDVTNSSVGNIPADLVKFLDPIINELLKGVIIPIVNKKFPGIPIPTVAGVDISDFRLKSRQEGRSCAGH